MRAVLASLVLVLGCKSAKEPASTPPPTTGSGSATTTPAPAPPVKRTYALCHDGGWCWAWPALGGNRLTGVVARAADDVWAIGEWGTVVHWDGKAWRPESVGTARLNRVWPRAADDVWVVGDGGFVARRDATGWTPIASGTSNDLLGVHGAGADDVWLTGKAGTVLHWDGTKLARVTGGGFAHALYAVGAAANDAVYIGGLGLYRHDGKTWRHDDTLGLTFFPDMRVLGATDVWAVDDLGRIVHTDGKRWQLATATGSVPLDDDADALYADGHQSRPRFSGTASDLWLTGATLALQLRDGRWRQVARFPKLTRASTRIDASTGFVGVGYGGRIFRGRGEPWTDDVALTSHSIQRIVPLPDGTLLVGGYGEYAGLHGRLAIFDGTKLTPLAYDGPVAGLAARSATDIFTAGARGELRHFDGKTWSSTTVSPNMLRALWIGDKHGWAVGDDGTIARWDGAAWTLVPSSTHANLDDVWAASATDAWAIGTAGKDGVVLHWDGTAWSVARELPGEWPNALAGIDAKHVWLATAKDLLAWDGTAWHTAPGWTAGAPGYELAARAPDDVWAASAAAVHHYDGTTWTTTPIGFTGLASLAITEHAIWLGGEYGALVVKPR